MISFKKIKESVLDLLEDFTGYYNLGGFLIFKLLLASGGESYFDFFIHDYCLLGRFAPLLLDPPLP